MAYVQNTWYVAGWAKDFEASKPQGLSILGEPIVVWRDDHGDIHALENRCVHRLAPLALGRCEGANLRCMYHGLLFNSAGQVIEIPGQADIPSIAKVRHYPVVEQDSWIWVWMGDVSLADPTLIPRVFGIDHPGWMLRHGQLDYEAEARLINDNLTDFSHLAFVHRDSFAVNEGFAKAKTVVTSIPGGVRIQRWAEDQPPVGQADSPILLDVYLTYDYLVPGILSLTTNLYPQGTFKKTGMVEPEDGLEFLRMYSAQAVTPTGSRTTRYFFSNGSRAPADPQQVEDLWTITLQAFAEDSVMIEGQQGIIDLDPDRRIMPVVADKGTVLYNRLVDKMVREERERQKAA
jgi:phenylpropionate dioxygenase-like ring-hydroxylating dioxygenase large terminal subunit